MIADNQRVLLNELLTNFHRKNPYMAMKYRLLFSIYIRCFSCFHVSHRMHETSYNKKKSIEKEDEKNAIRCYFFACMNVALCHVQYTYFSFFLSHYSHFRCCELLIFSLFRSPHCIYHAYLLITCAQFQVSHIVWQVYNLISVHCVIMFIHLLLAQSLCIDGAIQVAFDRRSDCESEDNSRVSTVIQSNR